MDLIFDGHNDVLLRLHKSGDFEAFLTGDTGHIDLPRAREGSFAGGFFAVFVPPEGAIDWDELSKARYDLALPDPISADQALPIVLEQIAILLRLEAAGAVRICRSVSDLELALPDAPLAAIMHIEGAEAIDADFANLETLHALGLRSLGPVWSRPNQFGHGVPFRYPSSPDTGGGLTQAGVRLVKACNQLGIMVDLSHITEAGFWDAAKHSDAPLVATHSNAHAICSSPRNLTDRQLHAIRDSDGMVGLNFATAFLRPDGRMLPECGFDILLRHLDHLIENLGESRVGLGSDFDGAMVPKVMKDVAGLPNLTNAMRTHGYDDTLMGKLCRDNWVRVLGETWKD